MQKCVEKGSALFVGLGFLLQQGLLRGSKGSFPPFLLLFLTRHHSKIPFLSLKN